MYRPLPQRQSQASAAADKDSFLCELALLLGLSVASAPHLAAPATFMGPAGLVCRPHVLQDGEGIAVRPEVLLPMAVEQFSGNEVTRLLAMQAVLLNDGAWYLGVAPEGLLQLSFLGAIHTSHEAALAFDVASAVGVHVSRTLLEEGAAS